MNPSGIEHLHIGDLKADPRNSNTHTPENIGAIVDALHAVGPARSIVIDENGVVLCGHGVVEALGQVGIENVRVIERDANAIYAVRVRGLTERQKRELAIADNQSGRLSHFDPVALLRDVADFSLDLPRLGFGPDQIEALAGEVLNRPATNTADEQGLKELQVIVTCENHEQQQALCHRLTDEGFACRTTRRRPRRSSRNATPGTNPHLIEQREDGEH
jgi:ParB-like chromosome segregation protein Spo0J